MASTQNPRLGRPNILGAALPRGLRLQPPDKPPFNNLIKCALKTVPPPGHAYLKSINMLDNLDAIRSSGCYTQAAMRIRQKKVRLDMSLNEDPDIDDLERPAFLLANTSTSNG